MSLQRALDFVDTHCHLNFDNFDNDREQVVECARKNGISRILIPAIDIETSKSALHYASQFPEVYVAIGIHPNQGSGWINSTISELRVLAIKKKVVAIGEIGLDYYRERVTRAVQKKIFINQLELAGEFGLPVIVHNRDAFDDILIILQKWHRKLINKGNKLADYPGVMHSFSGDESFAREMIALNFKIGITGPVTFQKAYTLQSVVTNVPIIHFLLETDSPYLSPHPYRGKRNEPANVRIVAEKVAELKEESLDKVVKITTDESDKLFKWRDIH